MGNVIIFFAGMLATIGIGTKLKINIGLVAAAFAFVIGTAVGGLSGSRIIGLFPTTLFINYLLATFLFGFAGHNGTLKKLANHILYTCRNAGWLLGLLFFVVVYIASALGSGNSAPFFTSAICFSLAAQAGIHPLLVPVAIWIGSMIGSDMPWASGYAVDVGQLEIYYDPATTVQYVTSFYIWRAVFFIGLYLVLFVVLKAYKVKSSALNLEKPKPLDRKQKQSLAIIFAIIAAMILSAALSTLFPGLIPSSVADVFSFQTLSALGIIANILLKTAPYEDVLKHRIPWDTLLMLTLTGMYMALSEPLGVIEYLTQVLETSVPTNLILPGIVLLMAVMSFFVSGAVVIPMMLPLISVFAGVLNVSPAAVYCATQVGLTASSISPFSQGGASALSGCSDEAVRKKLLKQQTLLSILIAVVLVVVAALGGFSMLY